MVRIGTSGWSYDHWEGIVYPPGAPQRARLSYFVRQLDTVEVNNTYYRWPAEAVFAGWRERVPEGFLFAIKAPRGLTHVARLRSPERWLERMSPGLATIEHKLAVLLVQLPPTLAYDYQRLAYFLGCAAGRWRLAVEFRHASWVREDVFQLLERFGAAYCVMSGAQLPCVLRVTAPFVYARLHGPDHHHLYGGSYSDADIRWWADRIREWQDMGRDVFAYFNNDAAGNAVRNALALRREVGDGR